MHAIGPDLLIYLLTAKGYPKFVFVNETLSFFRIHTNSISISTNKLKVATSYNIAKAYFVENYISDDKLRKKFNTRLLIFLIKGGRNNVVRKIQDFYFNENKVCIDYLFLVELVLRKLFSIFGKTIFYLLVSRCIRCGSSVQDRI